MIALFLWCGCTKNLEQNTQQKDPIKVGSQVFTESVVLGEILRSTLQAHGIETEHMPSLGGPQIVWNALKNGEIDVYVEYYGTITHELFENEEEFKVGKPVDEILAKYDLMRLENLGFNNTYAMGMRESHAEKLNITKLSDLRSYPKLRFAFSNGFMDRKDGFLGMMQSYALPQKGVRGIQHALSYKALAEEKIDVTDLYSTDAEIEHYKLRTLKDDLGYFPRYDALILMRKDVAHIAPVLRKLTGRIDEKKMIAMNVQAMIDKEPAAQIAAAFVKSEFGKKIKVEQVGKYDQFFQQTYEHIWLVLVSMFFALLTSIPLGVWAAKKKRVGQLILGGVGVLQTIPALALLVFMIPLLGIGTVPAIFALYLYSLLPIVRSTCTGLQSIPSALRESADVIGLSSQARLFRIELPLASRSILAGIKTATVINIGTATLGALIGSGGYGQAILSGIRLNDIPLTLQGAIPAAVMAIVVQLMFEVVDAVLIPKGLRLQTGLQKG